MGFRRQGVLYLHVDPERIDKDTVVYVATRMEGDRLAYIAVDPSSVEGARVLRGVKPRYRKTLLELLTELSRRHGLGNVPVKGVEGFKTAGDVMKYIKRRHGVYLWRRS